MSLAYLDPGSGSMIAQAVVAGVAGAAVVGKVGWKRITSPFRSKSAGGAQAESAQAYGEQAKTPEPAETVEDR
jgi:hypothetical protein